MMCQQLKTSEYFRIAQKESGLAPQAVISCCSGINIGKIMELSKRQGYLCLVTWMTGQICSRQM